MRPGRLDRILYVGPPDRSGRVEILKIKMRSMAIGPDIDLEVLADLVRRLLSVFSFVLLRDSYRPMDVPERNLQLCAKTQLC